MRLKMVKLNNLQYNPNRDPQVYRRRLGEPFRIQAVLEGEGSAQAGISDAHGQALHSAVLTLPATYGAELRFDRVGSHVVTLWSRQGSDTIERSLRLDVLPAEAH